MRTPFPPARHAAAGLVLTAALTGCAGGGAATATTADPAATGPAAPTTTGPAAPTATDRAAASRPVAVSACAVPAVPVPTTGPAVDRFGARPVGTAYAFAADLLARTTFTEAPLADPRPGPARSRPPRPGSRPAH